MKEKMNGGSTHVTHVSTKRFMWRRDRALQWVMKFRPDVWSELERLAEIEYPRRRGKIQLPKSLEKLGEQERP